MMKRISFWFENLFLVKGDCYIDGKDFVIYCEMEYEVCAVLYYLFLMTIIKLEEFKSKKKRDIITEWINKCHFKIVLKGGCVKNGK